MVGGKDWRLAVLPHSVGCAVAVHLAILTGENCRFLRLLILQTWWGRYLVSEVVTVFGVVGAVFQAVCANDWTIIAWVEV